MTPEDLDLSERIIEYLRARREPASLSEIKFAVTASMMRTATVVTKLATSGDIIGESDSPRGRTYYRIARR
jgi:hypothetical protein